jgi:hypothetical protein
VVCLTGFADDAVKYRLEASIKQLGGRVQATPTRGETTHVVAGTAKNNDFGVSDGFGARK